MKLKYLGTAAAEGYPSVFCTCENCRKAWAAGGRNIRSRSQALVNGSLLIDFPCDSFYHMLQHRIDLTRIHHCLITHIHRDHFEIGDFYYLNKGFAHPGDDWAGITLYGSEDITEIVGNLPETTGGKLRCRVVKPFEPFTVENLTVTALKASHGTPHPYIYMISDGDKTLLYAHDTDIFPSETWDYLRQIKPRFDLVSLDCTEGAQEELPYRAHMCLGYNRECREMLNETGCTDRNTVFVLNHFSHNGLHSTYDEFSVIAAGENFVTSYDGLEMTV